MIMKAEAKRLESGSLSTGSHCGTMTSVFLYIHSHKVRSLRYQVSKRDLLIHRGKCRNVACDFEVHLIVG